MPKEGNGQSELKKKKPKQQSKKMRKLLGKKERSMKEDSQKVFRKRDGKKRFIRKAVDTQVPQPQQTGEQMFRYFYRKTNSKKHIEFLPNEKIHAQLKIYYCLPKNSDSFVDCDMDVKLNRLIFFKTDKNEDRKHNGLIFSDSPNCDKLYKEINYQYKSIAKFDRNLPEKVEISRVLNSNVIVIDKSGKLLLTKRSPSQALPNSWCFPGGGVDLHEKPIEAAKRELFEECGLTVELDQLTPHLFLELDPFGNERKGYRIFMFIYYVCILDRD